MSTPPVRLALVATADRWTARCFRDDAAASRPARRRGWCGAEAYLTPVRGCSENAPPVDHAATPGSAAASAATTITVLRIVFALRLVLRLLSRQVAA